MSDAQPIDGAPKDGSRVLLFGVCKGEAVMADTEPMWVVGRWKSADEHPTNTWVVHPADYYQIRIEATHWKPLPVAP